MATVSQVFLNANVAEDTFENSEKQVHETDKGVQGIGRVKAPPCFVMGEVLARHVGSPLKA